MERSICITVCTFFLVFQATEVTATCSNILPGLTRMSSGVDITTLDLEPRDQLSSAGFKRLLFDIECDNGTRWTYNNQVYQIPDHVKVTFSIPTGSTTAATTLHRSVTDVQHTFRAAVGVSAFKYGMGSGSGSYESKLRSIRDNFVQISEVKFMLTTIEAALEDEISFSSSVSKAIALLPGNSTYKYATYREFFKNYGTHFIRNAKFGGKIQTNFKISQNYYLHHNSEQIKMQANAAFNKKITTEFHGGFETGTDNIDSSFEEFTTSETYYYGGSANILLDSGYQQWQPTVEENPWIISVELKPISSLLTDKAKAGELDSAYEMYLSENALAELEEILKLNLGKYQKRGLDLSIVYSLLKKVEKEKTAEVPNANLIYQLHDEVYFHFVLPDWWFDFELCLNSFRAEGSGTCDVSSNEKVCAPPEGYTYEYNDNENPAQCEIDAGLFVSHDTDEWAKDTELCFSIGGNSCEFTTEKMCQKANNYLFTGLNKLMNRDQICHVNFSTQNNNPNIPEWFKQIELCLVSYSEVSSEDEKLDIDCAALNSWVSSVSFGFHDSDCCVVRLGIFYMFPGNEKVVRNQLEKTTPNKQDNLWKWLDDNGRISTLVLIGVLILLLTAIVCYCCCKCRKAK
ncbi:perivitellin-2 67 kDa subunit-like [Convolutriloba macropyga]|uniref:perivitellin-2 67 kDa subunit-like n=1 Tax=Convolutriloba macropyga TaxID=536237 RepID=UPI003F521331